jgi:hypothetical protein
VKASRTIEIGLSKISVPLGKDLSHEVDGTILRRIIKKGTGSETPNEDAIVEVSLKGTYEGRVFDERTVTFIAGAGCVDNIPPGYVFVSL